MRITIKLLGQRVRNVPPKDSFVHTKSFVFRLELSPLILYETIPCERRGWYFTAGYQRTGWNLPRHVVGPSLSLPIISILILLLRTGIVNVIFSYVGMDIFAATAAESKALSNSESIKMASRKISLRIVTLYTLTMLTASFVVPADHPFINGGGQSVGAHSLFIIAVVEAGIPNAAHFFNAMFVFSAFTCAINSSYVASRVLHTLALQGQTGPEFITSRLRRCHNGVPIRAVLVTCFLMLVGYMGRTGAPGQVRLIITN